MKDFQDKVAVVTGAASGIGRALADKSATLGMKVVLTDIEESALKQTEEELKASGAQVLPRVCKGVVPQMRNAASTPDPLPHSRLGLSSTAPSMSLASNCISRL
jgi:NAD(P)-dependent dehydrogenase (short-subunit alcohol dehydrogenase family)